MEQLDYKLEYLLQKRTTDPVELSPIEEVTSPIESMASPVVEARAQSVRVLLHFKDSLEPIEALGFQKTSVAGDIASGFISLDAVEAVAAHPNLISIETSRPLKPELDVSSEIIKVNQLREELDASGTPCRGCGVIIGIIDSDFDVTHPCFLDDEGKSRVLALWDQNLNINITGNGKVPLPFGYGVEYCQKLIDTALDSGNPSQIIKHMARGSHGTHVTGIAGGNGRATPEDMFIGMAPEADLILVALNDNLQLGDSAFAMDAVCYLVDKAKRWKKPLVINLSQGDNFGPHDGTSLLEKAIDNLLEEPGVAFVKSAGNESDQGHHASGTIPANGEFRLEFEVPPFPDDSSFEPLHFDIEDDAFDIWYKGGDLFDVALETPSGPRTTPIIPGSSARLALPNGNEAFVYSQTKHPENSDNRINIILSRGERNRIEPGRWKIVLLSRVVKDGSFHAWIDLSKDRQTPRFRAHDVSCTVTIPGTSSKVITVGSFITKLQGDPLNRGDLAPGSGQGPTRARDSRTTSKPDITAPGFRVKSAGRRTNGSENYVLLSGTSMASPHVAGVVALLLEKKPDLKQEDIKGILQHSADPDEFTGALPNHKWGRGKLNALAALRALPNSALNIQHKGETTMSEQKLSDNYVPQNSTPADIGGGSVSEVQTVTLLGESERDGVTIPITITISVHNGTLLEVTAQDGNDTFTGEANIKLTRVPKPEENGSDECQCCGNDAFGVYKCRTCPC